MNTFDCNKFTDSNSVVDMKKDKYLKFYCVLFATILFLISMSAYGDEYDKTLNKKEFGLKGPVAIVTAKDCQFKEVFGELNRVGSKDQKIYFYSNGNVYKVINSPTSYKKYNYDDHGYLISEMEINKGAGECYKIDNSNFCDDDTTNIKVYKNAYDSNGKITETKVYSVRNGSSTQTERIVYSYTTGGKKITTHDKNGINKEVKYNGLSRVFREDTKQLSWRVCTDKLDNNGRIIKRIVTLEYEFMNQKKVQNVSSELYTYDNKGNVIKKSNTLHSKGLKALESIITVKYTYDNHGNWTRMLTYNGNKLISWQERDIIYADNDDDFNGIIQDNLEKEEYRKQEINRYKNKIAEKNAALAVEKEKEIAKGPICEIPDNRAHFPGDSNYSSDNLKRWIAANKRNLPYNDRVRVSFIVERDGSISNEKIVLSKGDELDKEAIRLVKNMPKWVPANKDGEDVRSNYSLDIFF